ncbi:MULTISPECIES: MerR family transcriptional regulator [Paraburkholderia]|uniref:MerR family transcriptional regulator n=1 Tax=Paraburkholderia TaxID=1822464 RepID=UPI001FE6DA85|nr:helix-turn-helix domain-containing protein [Paraburkholderia podalyriae]
MTIGNIAERSGCTVPTIRYYEEIGLLPKAARKAGGHRVYGPMDLQRLVFVRRCREFGFPIEEIRMLISLAESADRNCNEARDLAQSHLGAVRAKLIELQALEQSLAAFVTNCNAACAGGPATDCVILADLASTTSKCCGSLAETLSNAAQPAEPVRNLP